MSLEALLRTLCKLLFRKFYKENFATKGKKSRSSGANAFIWSENEIYVRTLDGGDEPIKKLLTDPELKHSDLINAGLSKIKSEEIMLVLRLMDFNANDSAKDLNTRRIHVKRKMDQIYEYERQQTMVVLA